VAALQQTQLLISSLSQQLIYSVIMQFVLPISFTSIAHFIETKMLEVMVEDAALQN